MERVTLPLEVCLLGVRLFFLLLLMFLVANGSGVESDWSVSLIDMSEFTLVESSGIEPTDKAVEEASDQPRFRNFFVGVGIWDGTVGGGEEGRVIGEREGMGDYYKKIIIIILYIL